MAGRRNPIPPEIEAQLLEMPELKRGRFIKTPSTKQNSDMGGGEEGGGSMSKIPSIGDFMIKSEEVVSGGVGLDGGGGGDEEDKDRGGMAKGYPNLNIDAHEEQATDTTNYSPGGTQNLLDIEPPVSSP